MSKASITIENPASEIDPCLDGYYGIMTGNSHHEGKPVIVSSGRVFLMEDPSVYWGEETFRWKVERSLPGTRFTIEVL